MECDINTNIRVWDKVEKKMVFLGEPIGSGGDILIGANDSIIYIKYPSYPPQATGFWEKSDRFISLNCSNKKDKEKNSIYVGDLVEDNDGHKWRISSEEILEKTLQVHITYFLLRNIIIPEKAYSLENLESDKNLKIFGNIYENPELKEQIKNAQ
jgi:hypothetical protein